MTDSPCTLCGSTVAVRRDSGICKPCYLRVRRGNAGSSSSLLPPPEALSLLRVQCKRAAHQLNAITEWLDGILNGHPQARQDGPQRTLRNSKGKRSR